LILSPVPVILIALLLYCVLDIVALLVGVVTPVILYLTNHQNLFQVLPPHIYFGLSKVTWCVQATVNQLLGSTTPVNGAKLVYVQLENSHTPVTSVQAKGTSTVNVIQVARQFQAILSHTAKSSLNASKAAG